MNVYFLIDGKKIKAARGTKRRPPVKNEPALRVFRPNGSEDSPAWGATISGEIRVFRLRIEDEFKIELLDGRFDLGDPEPDKLETTKHVYIQQSLRKKQLEAMIAFPRGSGVLLARLHVIRAGLLHLG